MQLNTKNWFNESEVEMSESCKHHRGTVSKPFSPSLPFSPAVTFGPFVFVSGIIGRNFSTGEIAIGDIESQTRQAMENIRHQLELAGSSLERVLKVTVFITDMKLFQRMNKVYSSFFEGDYPARSCAEVSAVPDPEAMVEIECIAGC
jgi:2-iminobutanoate/2-iminopropanoate deaminase